MALLRYLGLAGELGAGTTLGACPAEGAVFGIGPGESLFIGRGASSQVVIDSNRVARAHLTCALMPGTGDRLVVTDLESTNETEIGGQVRQVGVLSPGEEIVIAGLFRFRFEDGEAPGRQAAPVPQLSGGARLPVGIVLLVAGLLLGGFSTCSKTWFSDAAGHADIGLYSSRVCTDDGCKTEDLGVIFDDDNPRREERSEVFQFVAGGTGAFYWFAAATGLWGLIQLIRRRRPTALWVMLPMLALTLIAAQIVIGLVPVELRGADPARVRFGAYLHGLGALLAGASAFLLLPRRRRE